MPCCGRAEHVVDVVVGHLFRLLKLHGNDRVTIETPHYLRPLTLDILRTEYISMPSGLELNVAVFCCYHITWSSAF